MIKLLYYKKKKEINKAYSQASNLSLCSSTVYSLGTKDLIFLLPLLHTLHIPCHCTWSVPYKSTVRTVNRSFERSACYNHYLSMTGQQIFISGSSFIFLTVPCFYNPISYIFLGEAFLLASYSPWIYY